MTDIVTNKDRRKSAEEGIKNLATLIVNKLPSPNEENQTYWDNIYEAIKEECRGENSEEKLVELKRRFPVFDAIVIEEEE
ncbi:MAG: hypothetical protein LBB16_02835 [Puniceicoccales bacterium]|jgi:hypothetical protein|nr:hypothetical protein [Puniceicoccales bacterium]